MYQSKKDFLEHENIINPRADRVTHPKFRKKSFLDPLDLPQVRYEMLRMVKVEKSSVSQACKTFGFSREYFYRLDRTFSEKGIPGVLGSSKPGRNAVIGVNKVIMSFLSQRLQEDTSLTGEKLRKEVLSTFKVTCSRRTVERIVARIRKEK